MTTIELKTVQDLYQRGLSYKQIQRVTGVADWTFGEHLRKAGVVRSRGAGKVSSRYNGATPESRKRIEDDRSLVRMVKCDGAALSFAGSTLGIPRQTASKRYHHSIYCLALRQYVYGEDVGLLSNHGTGKAAREYLRSQGIPPHLIDSLLPKGDDV